MQTIRKTIIAMFLLAMAACSSTPIQVPEILTVDAPVYHPHWPEPYTVCPINWEASGVDARVSTDWNGNVTAKQCHEDMVRYLKQLRLMVCSYRTELYEDKCKEINE